MADRFYYCLCDAGCKFETMTKEQILAAITQAVELGEVKAIDSGIYTALKEINTGKNLRFWVGTTAEYNALGSYEANVLYIKTDDNAARDINYAINMLAAEVQALARATDFKVNQLVTDWNKALVTGYYYSPSSGCTNGPLRVAGAFTGKVEALDGNNLTQTLTNYNGEASTGAETWIRKRIDGEWGEWRTYSGISGITLGTESITVEKGGFDFSSEEVNMPIMEMGTLKLEVEESNKTFYFNNTYDFVLVCYNGEMPNPTATGTYPVYSSMCMLGATGQSALIQWGREVGDFAFVSLTAAKDGATVSKAGSSDKTKALTLNYLAMRKYGSEL